MLKNYHIYIILCFLSASQAHAIWPTITLFSQYLAQQSHGDLIDRGFTRLAADQVFYSQAIVQSYQAPSAPLTGFQIKKSMAQEICATMSYLSCEHELQDQHDAYPHHYRAKIRQANDMALSLTWIGWSGRAIKYDDLHDVVSKYRQHSPQSNLFDQFKQFSKNTLDTL